MDTDVQTMEIAVNPGQTYQSWEGFGTSLAWWGNVIGGKDAELRNKLIDLVVNPETGLGYNIFRYNIGGGENPLHHHMREGADIPGYQPEPGVWDWEADPRQRQVLTDIIAKGENLLLEAFSNSPPYWMTHSGCAAGHVSGNDNLKDEYYDDFAEYLTEVVLHFKETWGISFHSLEPMNEPDADWWKAQGNQEGCRFHHDKQQKIILEVAKKLEEKNLSDVHLSAADFNNLRWAIGDMLELNGGYSAETWDAVEQINVHTYFGWEYREQVFEMAKARGKRLWMSESGPLNWEQPTPHETGERGVETDAALYMAGVIIDDLRLLRPTAWVDWQTVDTHEAWTSFTIDEQNNDVAPTKRFYMHAQFSRFIRPGATFVDIAHDNAVAAVAADGKTLAIVLRNNDKSDAKSFRIDLSLFDELGPSAAVHRTSRTEDLLKLDDILVEDQALEYTAPSYSVTSLVVSLVKDATPEPNDAQGGQPPTDCIDCDTSNDSSGCDCRAGAPPALLYAVGVLVALWRRTRRSYVECDSAQSVDSSRKRVR